MPMEVDGRRHAHELRHEVGCNRQRDFTDPNIPLLTRAR